MDFIARLAALVPKPRVNLTRYHGVFAPNSAHRARVTKAHRGKGARAQAAAETDERAPAERRASMRWAQRLKRVFGIDIEACPVCGGALRIIACIEDPAVIERILGHLDAKAATAQATRPPPLFVLGALVQADSTTSKAAYPAYTLSSCTTRWTTRRTRV